VDDGVVGVPRGRWRFWPFRRRCLGFSRPMGRRVDGCSSKMPIYTHGIPFAGGRIPHRVQGLQARDYLGRGRWGGKGRGSSGEPVSPGCNAAASPRPLRPEAVPS
jgi:hypothetical protein